ncbi:MAG: hypothetical protein WDO17_22175 [Alphaproteobacteria bacterium]
MTVFRILTIFGTRMLAAAGVAAATMLLGWIMTAHAASLVPDDTGRENPILCERIPDMICQPDVPGLVTRPATLVVPDTSRTGPARRASAAGPALTNF